LSFPKKSALELLSSVTGQLGSWETVKSFLKFSLICLSLLEPSFQRSRKIV